MNRRRMISQLMIVTAVAATTGCNNSTEIPLIDPGKVEVPPPPEMKPGDPGAAAPKGGGSPSGDPSEYSK